jgi:hypothetical protein
MAAGTGDDKTDIVVIADFWGNGGLFSRDKDLSLNAFYTFGGSMVAALMNLVAFKGSACSSRKYFSVRESSAVQCEHPAAAFSPDAQTSPLYEPVCS